MIRIIYIINRIMGVHKSFIELHNSIIIRNLYQNHKFYKIKLYVSQLGPHPELIMKLSIDKIVC